MRSNWDSFIRCKLWQSPPKLKIASTDSFDWIYSSLDDIGDNSGKAEPTAIVFDFLDVLDVETGDISGITNGLDMSQVKVKNLKPAILEWGE